MCPVLLDHYTKAKHQWKDISLVLNETPFSDEVLDNDEIKKERVQDDNYRLDL